MTQIIKIAQYIDTINRLFGVMKVKNKIEAFQEDDMFYAEFNPFLVVAEQHMDVLTDVNNQLHTATVMVGFNVAKPNEPIVATSFKLNGQSTPFVMSVSFNEFIEKLAYASAKLSAAMLSKMANNATQFVTEKAVVKEVMPDDSQYQNILIRDYKLNHKLMQIVPKDTGGAVLMFHADEMGTDRLKVYFKFSLCSRDDKFDVKIGKQVAKECEPIVFIDEQGNSLDTILENALYNAIFISVEQKSQFKRMVKLARKQFKL